MKEYSLGTWDLSCLAPHHESSAFREKLKEIEEKVDEFEKKKSLLKNDIPSEDFYGIVRLCEELSEEMSKIGHYAHLLFASDTSNPKVRSLLAKVDERSKAAERRGAAQALLGSST